MATDAKNYRDVHQAADVLEPRLERQFLRAVKEIQAGVEIDKLALALARGDEKLVMQLLDLEIQEELEPVARTMIEAFNRGGRIGAKQINAL